MMNHKSAPKELQPNLDYRKGRTVCGIDIEKRRIVTSDYRITCPNCLERVIAEMDLKVTALREILSKLKVRVGPPL